MTPPNAPRSYTLPVLILAMALTSVLGATLWRGGPGARPTIRAELRSWVVAGRGRHLFLQIEAPAPNGGTMPRIEFTNASLRRDYRAPSDPALGGRVCRMNAGLPLHPVFGEADNRIEAVYWLTAHQFEELTRDRVWSAGYSLLGTNSNSGMARVLKDVGLSLPPRVRDGGGILGEFPGIDRDPGPEIQRSQWERYGIGAPGGG